MSSFVANVLAVALIIAGLFDIASASNPLPPGPEECHGAGNQVWAVAQNHPNGGYWGAGVPPLICGGQCPPEGPEGESGLGSCMPWLTEHDAPAADLPPAVVQTCSCLYLRGTSIVALVFGTSWFELNDNHSDPVQCIPLVLNGEPTCFHSDSCPAGTDCEEYLLWGFFPGEAGRGFWCWCQ